MVIQMQITGEMEKKMENHRKKYYPHLNKKAFIVEMAMKGIEEDKRK